MEVRLCDAMISSFVPLPWPMMIVLSASLGSLAFAFLYNSRHFRDIQLREGILGLSVLSAVGVFLIWLIAMTRMSLRSSAQDQEAFPIIACAILGLLFAACVFGIAVFVLTFGCLTLRIIGGAERKEEEERRTLAEAESERLERLHLETAAHRQEAERLALDQARLKADAQFRREKAWIECDSAYAIAAPEIANRFSKADFSAFVSKYMTDSFPPEQVEERAVQLKAIIQQHQEKIIPAPKFRSIQELAGWFESQKLEIETVQDARIRATLMVQLKERYSELTAQMLSEFSP